MANDNDSFTWPRIHKWEENIEREITDSIWEYICEFYNVEEITDLTLEQIQEVEAFKDNLNKYSIMHLGFSNVINHWENENWETEYDD